VRWRPAIPLGTWSGVEIRLDVLVVMLIAVLFFGSLNTVGVAGTPASTIWAAVAHLVLLVAMLFCMFLHELGHALACKMRGHKPRMILLSFVGLTFFEAKNAKPADEFWIAVSGPAVNAGIALATAPFIFVALADADAPPLLSIDAIATVSGFLAWVSMLNFAVAALNLMPGWPADGARALRGHLARKYGYGAGTVRAVAISHGFWLILAGVAVLLMTIAPLIKAVTGTAPAHRSLDMIVLYQAVLLAFAAVGILYGMAEKRRVARLGAERAAAVVGPPPEFMPGRRTEARSERSRSDEETGEARDRNGAEKDSDSERLKAAAKGALAAGKGLWWAAKTGGKGLGWMARRTAKVAAGKPEPKDGEGRADNRKD
jgi:Zn-dependent protease